MTPAPVVSQERSLATPAAVRDFVPGAVSVPLSESSHPPHLLR
jgi:hypothetical protein